VDIQGDFNQRRTASESSGGSPGRHNEAQSLCTAKPCSIIIIIIISAIIIIIIAYLVRIYGGLKILVFRNRTGNRHETGLDSVSRDNFGRFMQHV
jgi:hypothetical protein